MKSSTVRKLSLGAAAGAMIGVAIESCPVSIDIVKEDPNTLIIGDTGTRIKVGEVGVTGRVDCRELANESLISYIPALGGLDLKNCTEIEDDKFAVYYVPTTNQLTGWEASNPCTLRELNGQPNIFCRDTAAFIGRREVLAELIGMNVTLPIESGIFSDSLGEKYGYVYVGPEEVSPLCQPVRLREGENLPNDFTSFILAGIAGKECLWYIGLDGDNKVSELVVPKFEIVPVPDTAPIPNDFY